jgi:hypothetical protein
MLFAGISYIIHSLCMRLWICTIVCTVWEICDFRDFWGCLSQSYKWDHTFKIVFIYMYTNFEHTWEYYETET